MNAAAVAVVGRRAFGASRVPTAVFGYLFAVYSWLEVAGYHSAFPTHADRLAFARAFAGNPAIRLFFGYPYRVGSVGGYSAWRVGDTLSLLAATYGVLVAVRALRTEEDAGRSELVLAGTVGRRALLAGDLAAIGAGSWLLRVVADIVPGAAGLRWASPLGWAELLRPFATSRPVVLLLPAVVSAALVAVAASLGSTRDVGTGLLPTRDSARPSPLLLSSPARQAARAQHGALGAWAFGLAVFGLVLGTISTSMSAAGIPARLQRELRTFGGGSIFSPTGYLAFVFLLFVLAACLFACGQVGAARAEESGQQLETLLALPVGRVRWLLGRLLLAAAATAVLAAIAGVSTWVGAASQGVAVSLPQMLEAAANCLPSALVFLGVAALGYATVPRASGAVSYGLVAAAFLWYLVGSLLGLPAWVVDATPFEHIGLVPTEAFRPGAALVMAGVAAATGALALAVFRRRDLRAA